MDKAAWKTARRAESRMMDESSTACPRRHLPSLHAASFLCPVSVFYFMGPSLLLAAKQNAL